MSWVAPAPASLAAFLAVVAAVAGALAWGTRRPLGVVAWMALTGAAPLALQKGMPIPVFFVLVMVTAVATACSPVGGRLAALPMPLLVGFQAFRLPLEGVLHVWAATGTVPPQMTWTGDNLDVVTGLVSLALAPFARRPAVAWVANVVGAALLANVIRVVALSTPGPLQRYPEPVLLALHFPTVWIGSVCVGGALLGHLVSVRALLARRVGSAEAPGATSGA